MLPQAAPLPPDIMYFLDNALDDYNISAFDHAILCLYGDRKIVPELVDRQRPQGRGWRFGIGAICVDLDRHAHDVARHLSIADQRAFFAASLLREPGRLISLAECMAGWNYEDETCGGALKPFRDVVRLTRHHKPTPKLRRHLYAPGAIRRYVRINGSDSYDHARLLAKGLRKLPWPAHPDEAARMHHHFDAQQIRLEETRRRAWAQMIAPKPLDREQRKTLRRAAAVASSTIGSAQAGAFMRGDEIELRGGELVFRVSGNLRRADHGALRIQLQSLAGATLAGLCVFFTHTPALDQVAAIALHLSAGEERDLLRTGNLYNVTPEGARHPLIAERLKKDAADLEQARVRAARGAYQLIVRHDRRREEQGKYIKDTAPLYLHAVTQEIWGTDAKRVAAFASHIGDFLEVDLGIQLMAA